MTNFDLPASQWSVCRRFQILVCRSRAVLQRELALQSCHIQKDGQDKLGLVQNPLPIHELHKRHSGREGEGHKRHRGGGRKGQNISQHFVVPTTEENMDAVPEQRMQVQQTHCVNKTGSRKYLFFNKLTLELVGVLETVTVHLDGGAVSLSDVTQTLLLQLSDLWDLVFTTSTIKHTDEHLLHTTNHASAYHRGPVERRTCKSISLRLVCLCLYVCLVFYQTACCSHMTRILGSRRSPTLSTGRSSCSDWGT